MELKDILPFLDPETLKRWKELQQKRDWDEVDWTKPKTFTDLANIVRNSGLGGDVREALAKMFEEVSVMVGAGANETQAQQLMDLIKSISDGSPKGVFTNLAALEAKYPTGASGVYITSDNGHWYYWNSTTSAWTDGGVYQATGSSEFPATNIATNGNFANGITGWRAEGGTLTATEGEATMTFSSLSVTTRVERTLDDIVPNHKYYIRTEIYPKFSNVTYYSIGDSSIPNVQQPFYPDANKWNKVSQIQTSKTNARFRVYHRTNTNYSVEDTFKIKNVVVIDLTETFGFGNEPSRSEMDEILSKYPNSYFEGTVAPLLSNKDIYLDFTAFLTEPDKEWVL